MPRIRRLKSGQGGYIPSPYLHAFQLWARGEALDNPYPDPSPSHDQFKAGAAAALTGTPFDAPYPPGLFSEVKHKPAPS